MVAVPADAAADVQQNLIHEGHHGGDLVGDDLRRMEVAHVEAQELLVRDGVAQVELVRADDVALGADAEQLALHRVSRCLRFIGWANISSSDFFSRSRGPLRSTGMSL